MPLRVVKQTVLREFNRIAGDLVPRIRAALTEVEQSGSLFVENEIYVHELVHEEFSALRSFRDVYEENVARQTRNDAEAAAHRNKVNRPAVRGSTHASDSTGREPNQVDPSRFRIEGSL